MPRYHFLLIVTVIAIMLMNKEFFKKYEKEQDVFKNWVS